MTVPSMPREAWAALASGLGLAAGYVLHHHPLGVPAYVVGMAAGALPAFGEAGQSLRKGRLDVHSLMLAAAAGAWAIGKPGEGASLLFLFALSGALEAFAMGRTKEAIRRLVRMRPQTLRRPDESIVPVEQAAVGDLFLVFPGETIPLDGVIEDGLTSVDQAAMTGEAEPVTRAPGDKVMGGTLNLEGRLLVRASAAQKDSALERVIALVAAAQEEKSLASSERLAGRVGRFYAPLVLAGATLWFLIRWRTLPLAEASYPPLTLLVAASPCALVLSSPAAVLSALAAAGRRGLLIRSGAALENLARIDTVAFDKTGTLTTGKPSLQSVWSSLGSGDGARQALLARAAAIEAPLPHPLARAIVRAAAREELALPLASDFQSLAGKGVIARIDQALYRIGRPEWIWAELPPELAEAMRSRVEAARADGASVVAVAWPDGIGLLTLVDTVRDDARPALEALRDLGIGTLLLTGDHLRAGEALRRHLPLADIRADLHPEDKAAILGELEAAGHGVGMVGDGVNDAPALSRATVGITLGGIGSDVALESADVVVMEDRLSGVPEAIHLARRARTIATQSVVLSLAGVVLLSLTVLLRDLPLPWAVVFHEGTTVLVVLNGLRLLRARA